MNRGEKGKGSRRYKPISVIAHGGMARVDLAVRNEGKYARLFAVKRLYPHMRDDDEFRKMFVDEGRIAGLIRHANVVSVVDVGEDSDGPYLVMDYIDGLPLHRVIRGACENQRELPLALCLSIAKQVAHGLHAAHTLHDMSGRPLHLVHRDVSPQNILVGFDGVARVTDFGIARALGRITSTLAGVAKGKLGYMSPEQRVCKTPDHRSDIYSLGVVLFETLTLRRLHPSSEDGHEPSKTPVIADVGEYRDDVPADLVQLVFRMLAQDPQERPSTADEVAHELGIILDGLGEARTIDVGAYLQTQYENIMIERRTEITRALQTTQHELRRVRRRTLSRAASAGVILVGLVVAWNLASPSFAVDGLEEPGAVSPQQVTPVVTASPAQMQPISVGDEAAVDTEPVLVPASKPAPRKINRRRPKRAKTSPASNATQRDTQPTSKVPWWEW